MRIEQMTFKAAAAAVERGEFPRRRRIALVLDWADYWKLKTAADREGVTLSNYIRACCDLEPERQGVRRAKAKKEK